MLMRLELLFLLLLAFASQAESTDALALLKHDPAKLALQAAGRGDTRLIEICRDDEVPALHRIYPWPAMWKRSGRLSGVDCEQAQDPETKLLNRKLQIFALAFNKAMAEYIYSQGLFPVYPSDAQPNHEPSTVQLEQIGKLTSAALDDFLKFKRPASLKIGETLAWTTHDGEISRVFIEAQLGHADIAKAFQPQRWKEIATPQEFSEAAHSAMPTAIGQVAGFPAYLFLAPLDDSEYVVMLNLIVEAGAQQPIPPEPSNEFSPCCDFFYLPAKLPPAAR